MRRKIALLLSVLILFSVVINPIEDKQVYASVDAKQIINAIGIMNTDKGSNRKETAVVTRARFAQMLVNISSLKTGVSSESNTSVFKDVKKSYWAAGYIQTVITQGWMSGYLNGTFKPDRGVTLQEAVAAVEKLLGYTNSDFGGNLFAGIMKLYKSKGLNKNISKTKSQYLTVNDCYYLFYNMLKAATKTGSTYAESLGYTLDSSGELDYLSLVKAGMQGPIIADANWKNELPFPAYQAVYYKDGVACSSADVFDYDVLYYSESLKTVWIYDNKVTGTVETVNPDYTTPTSVTLSGTEYTFGNSNVTEKFMGDIKKGDIVTLILDKDKKVAGVLGTDEYNATISGIVLEKGTHLVENASSTYVNQTYIKFIDAAGNTYEQDCDNTSVYFSVGDIARITYENGTATVSKLNVSIPSFGDNTFNSSATVFGTIQLASNVKILDIYHGQYKTVYAESLKNVAVPSSSVLYYELNQNGQLSQLILNNVTGDLCKYGIFTGISAPDNSAKMNYSYLIGSKAGSLSTSLLTDLSTESGPTKFVFTDDVLTASYALNGIKVSSIGKTTIVSGNQKYPIADQCYVYQIVDGDYVSMTLDKMPDLTKYNVMAYYDKAASSGGKIRVIVASAK